MAFFVNSPQILQNGLFGVAIFLQESMMWMISSSVYPSKSCGIVIDIFTSFCCANILSLFLAAE